MRSNKSLLRKADIALSDLSSDGGLLQPEQANTFIRKLIVSPTILREVRTVTMSAPQRKINKIGFGQRILRKAVSGVALTQSQRAKPTTEQITLTTSEVMAEVRLPYDVLEDNIEAATSANNEAANSGPGGLRTTLISMIAERAATDLEEAGLLCDTASGDDYLALQNGWLKRASAEGNVVDIANAAINKSVFKRGKKALPKQYLREMANMRHYVSPDQETEYVDTLADRGTALGDRMLEGRQQAYAYGSPVAAITQMPDAEGLFCNPKNLIMGVQRDISMEYDKIITERVYVIVLTCRIAFQIEEADAVVYYDNIGAAA